MLWSVFFTELTFLLGIAVVLAPLWFWAGRGRGAA